MHLPTHLIFHFSRISRIMETSCYVFNHHPALHFAYRPVYNAHARRHTVETVKFTSFRSRTSSELQTEDVPCGSSAGSPPLARGVQSRTSCTRMIIATREISRETRAFNFPGIVFSGKHFPGEDHSR